MTDLRSVAEGYVGGNAIMSAVYMVGARLAVVGRVFDGNMA
jgi:hypothetical protein